MNTFVALSLILGASAFAVPRSSCSFELTASGGESGTIGQLSDGQNRIGGGLSPATFTINNGGIIDSEGRGCILTRKYIPNSTSFIADSFIASVEQFQCDQGVGPTFALPSTAMRPLRIPEAPCSTPAQHQRRNGICTPHLLLAKRSVSRSL
jgi:hypothetical protein